MELNHLVEGFATIVLALLSYFGKRTLSNYDARLEKSEKEDEKLGSRDDEIIKSLNVIQIRVERIEAILHSRKSHYRSTVMTP